MSVFEHIISGMEEYVRGKNCVVKTRDQVRAVDSWAINEVGIAGVVLMENAGRSCAELIKDKLEKVETPKVCIFCGTGNNGGDGFVIARHLLNAGFQAAVVICGYRGKIKGDARINLEILEKLGRPIDNLSMNESNIAGRVDRFAAGADMIIDALLGTGLSGELNKEYKQLIESINVLDVPVLAVDIPSGLDCDAGTPLGGAIRANYTVTFVAVKTGFTNPQAEQYTGRVYLASIGVEPN